MSAIDLQIRMARKLAAGRGGMELSQADLDVLLQSKAYDAICQAANLELCQKRKDLSPSTSAETINSTVEPIEQILKSSGMTEQPDVSAEVARALATLPKPSKPLIVNTSRKKPARPADAHMTGKAA